MQPIAKLEVYSRIKRIIAGVKDMAVSEILADQVLRDPPLRFETKGVRALAPYVNQAFKDCNVQLTPTQVGAAKTVRDLVELVWSKIPEA